MEKIKRSLLYIFLLVSIVSCSSLQKNGGLIQAGSLPLTGNDDISIGSPRLEAESMAYYHFILAYQHEISNENDAAITEYTSALSFDKGSSVILVNLATLWAKKGDLKKAISYLETALKTDPRR
ncbi:MAG: tetratricopeptide repeat protein, partial [Nitrospirota bacterium]